MPDKVGSREIRLDSAPSAFRTIFFVENSNFMWEFAPEALDVDTLAKNRPDAGMVPFAPVKWTWLTWCTEALFEYSRIAWDVYPAFKISIFGCQQNREPLTVCPLEDSSDSNHSKVSRFRDLRLKMLTLAKHRLERSSEPGSVAVAPLEKIIASFPSLESDELLSAPIFDSPVHQIASDKPFFIRIVLLTSETDPAKLNALFRRCLIDQHVAYLARYEIAIISVGAKHKTVPVPQKLDKGEDIYITHYNATVGPDIVDCLKSCVALDLGLLRTTVTDIPMKEDAKTGGSTSFSFNVDLYHPYLRDPHHRRGNRTENSLRMKWVKPVKGIIPNYVPLEEALPLRASPSDPTTRPTQCLVGYVVDGNAVLLESQEKPGTACKLFLCGGKICLLQLRPGGDKHMDDMPSLAELPGGRVGTYRVKEMVALMSSLALDQKAFPLRKLVYDQQNQLTAYFPLVYSDTIVYLLPQLVPLFDALNASDSRHANWAAARDSIMEVVGLEKSSEALPVSNSHLLLQGISSHKKSEVYAILWAELDMLLEANANKSPEHAQLRSYLHSAVRRPIREEIKVTIRERQRVHSQVPLERKADFVKKEQMTVSKKRKARPEFEGRVKYGRYGQLYQNLQKTDKKDDALIHASLEL